MNQHTDRPDRPPGVGYVELRDFFTLWLERLEVFYARRFEDLESKTTMALTASDKAVTKAEIATEKRFEGVNEFRATLADQATRLMPREESLSKFAAIEKDITALNKEVQALREQRSSISARELERDQSRQDVTTRHSWLIPMLIVGGIAIINLVLNIFLTFKTH